MRPTECAQPCEGPVLPWIRAVCPAAASPSVLSPSGPFPPPFSVWAGSCSPTGSFIFDASLGSSVSGSALAAGLQLCSQRVRPAGQDFGTWHPGWGCSRGAACLGWVSAFCTPVQVMGPLASWCLRVTHGVGGMPRAPRLTGRVLEDKCYQKLGRVPRVLIGHFVPCLPFLIATT